MTYAIHRASGETLPCDSLDGVLNHRRSPSGRCSCCIHESLPVVESIRTLTIERPSGLQLDGKSGDAERLTREAGLAPRTRFVNRLGGRRSPGDEKTRSVPSGDHCRRVPDSVEGYLVLGATNDIASPHICRAVGRGAGVHELPVLREVEANILRRCGNGLCCAASPNRTIAAPALASCRTPPTSGIRRRPDGNFPTKSRHYG